MMRHDKDSLGQVTVSDRALWGAQTERARGNFHAFGHFPALVRALAQVKLAAARVNADQGRLDPDLANAINAAAGEVIEGDHDPLGCVQPSSVA